MKKIFLYHFLIFLSAGLAVDFSFGQCSDAGVCRVSNIGNEKRGNKLSISLSYNNGYSGKEDDVIFHTFQLNTQYKFFPTSSFNILIPYNMQSGPGGNVNGIGDLIIIWDQELFSASSALLMASIGMKLATGNENKEPALPQHYQPGLGSNDLILTLNFNFDKFGLGAGYQSAGGRNDKEGIKLKRSDNLLLKVSYHIPFDYLQISPQFLFIKPLSKSTILDLNSSVEKFIDVDKSDQAQLNLFTEIQYYLNENYAVYSELALPLLKRDFNIDGLKRSYTASLGIRFIF